MASVRTKPPEGNNRKRLGGRQAINIFKSGLIAAKSGNLMLFSIIFFPVNVFAVLRYPNDVVFVS